MIRPERIKSNYRIAFYTIGDRNLPSTRFRIFQYLKTLERKGFVFDLFTLPSIQGSRIRQCIGLFWQAVVRWSQLRRASQYDLLFIQKGLTPCRFRWLAKKLWKTGIPYIIDLDDAVHIVKAVELPIYLRWLQDEEELPKLIKQARRVILGNRYLAESVDGEQTPVSLIPTPVDTDKYRPLDRPVSRKEIVIGWSGSRGTNPYANLIFPVLVDLAKRYSFTFLMISDHQMNLDLSKLVNVSWRFIRWQAATELQDLQKIDIGVMPLPEDDWCRGKCGLKALLYMSLGLPAVCSPVGVNAEMITDGGNGFLAKTREEWTQKLSRLMEDPDLRQKVGNEARKSVEERYSVKANASQWIQALEEALSKRTDRDQTIKVNNQETDTNEAVLMPSVGKTV